MSAGTGFAPRSSVPELSIPFERSVLPCGATLIVSPRPGAPVCAMQAHVRGGPAQDPPGHEGVAWLAGALADQGTRNRDEEEIASLLEPEGGELSGDAAGLAGTIVGDRWELLAELLCDLLTSASYPREQFRRHRQRLLDRLLLERDDPRQQGGLLFRRLVYGDHWLGRAAYGSIASVRRIQPEHLRAHRAANWVGRRTILSVCGDVDPARVRRAFQRRLARWKPGTPLATTPPTFPPLAPRADAFHAQRAQVHLYLGHLGVPRSHPDFAALVVMDHVLGTGPGFTNRISRRLRDELGLAYAVQAAIHASAGILPGAFTAYIGTSPQHARTAIEGFRAEIRRLQTEPVPGPELDVAKSYLLGSFPLGFERAARRAGYLVSAELFGFPPDHLTRLLREFMAVTPTDVQRVAAAHLHPDRSCIAASGPLSRDEVAALAGIPAGRPRRRGAPAPKSPVRIAQGADRQIRSGTPDCPKGHDAPPLNSQETLHARADHRRDQVPDRPRERPLRFHLPADAPRRRPRRPAALRRPRALGA
jgi:zinc protease